MEVALHELGEIFTGNTPSKKNKNYWNSEDTVFIKPNDLNNNNLLLNDKNNEYISKEALAQARIVGRNSILVTCIGTIGKIAITTDAKTAFNQQINAIVPNKNVYTKYLAYALMHYKPRLAALANAPVVPIINKKQFSNFKINLNLDKEIQYTVIRQLDLVGEIIKNKNRQLSKLDELIKARFVEMFGDPQDSKSKWKKSTIEKCCTLKSGKTLPRNIENEGGNIPYVKVKDMNSLENMTYITTSTRFVSDKTANKNIFPVGTVIFPKRGGAIGTNKKRLTKVPICADLNIMGVIPDNTRINSYYLFEYFNMVDLNTLNNGSSVPQINNKDINPLNINIPPLSLQNEFANFVQQVDKSKFENIVYLNKTLSSKILSQLG
ncbi:type I restriction endonuclease, partial [Lactobacillus johnsonii]|uniref:restriction endonuclease subunit S n=1 Tax=Lactobacillus johnsonii TaxID=33959 RepID=UPI000B37E01C